MISDPDRTDQLARARELRQRGESARRRDDATARLCYTAELTNLSHWHTPFQGMALLPTLCVKSR
jgi:hypothetical protein